MNATVQEYTKTYELLKQNMKWKVSDKRILMTIASTYVMNNKSLDFNKLLQIADSIKDQASLFSSMKSYSRFTTAAMLDVNFEEPEEKISLLFDYYQKLRNAKFGSGTFTYLAATILLTNHSDTLSVEQLIQKAKDIYDGMKREHVFLTSSGDYPLATLLAYQEKEDVIQHIESYYELLSKNGFRKGNDLQFLSHILSISEQDNNQVLVNRAVEVFDQLSQHGIRPKPMYYPSIGILSLIPKEEMDYDTILQVFEELKNEKEFKWQKDLNVIMAISFFVNEKIEANGLAETSMYTILETILQAQQTVMIATMVGATAASSTNNG